jgi:hypothetical protein
MELREKLNQIAIKEKWEPTDETIVEMLRYKQSIKEYQRDEHRWYTLFRRVVQVEDFYVDFQDVHNSGDEPALEYEEVADIIIKSMKEVFPKEVTVIDYVEKL